MRPFRRILLVVLSVLAILTIAAFVYVYVGSAQTVRAVRAQEGVLADALHDLDRPGLTMLVGPSNEIEERSIRWGWFLDNSAFVGEGIRYFYDLGANRPRWVVGQSVDEVALFEIDEDRLGGCRDVVGPLDLGSGCRDTGGTGETEGTLTHIRFEPGVSGIVSFTRFVPGRRSEALIRTELRIEFRRVVERALARGREITVAVVHVTCESPTRTCRPRR